ncbi:hypothetical protein HGO21_28520 [Acinetobacter sp. CUI P1]|nr:hypothetical protein [Acinetobacter sp. CUI P1]
MRFIWTLREWTVVPIAVVSRFNLFSLRGKNPETKANAIAFPQSVRPLRVITL